MKGSLARETVANGLAHVDIEINGAAACDAQAHNDAVFGAVPASSAAAFVLESLIGDMLARRVGHNADMTRQTGRHA